MKKETVEKLQDWLKRNLSRWVARLFQKILWKIWVRKVKGAKCYKELEN